MSAVVVTPNYPERGGATASSAIKCGGIVRAGRPAPVILKTGTKSLNEVRLPASLFQSAVTPADTTGSRGMVLTASLRWFKFVGAFTALRAVFSSLHGALALFQSPARRVADVFHVLSYLPSCVSKHSQGTIAACAKNLSRRRKQ